jgi:multidrug resistance efflux pump
MTKGPPPSQSTSQPSGQGRITYLDQTLWRQLTEAGSEGEFFHAWLGLQSRMLSGAVAGVVVMGTAEAGPFAPVAQWVDGSGDSSHLNGVLERALVERKGVVRREGATDPPTEDDPVHLSYPVRTADQLYGAVAFEIHNCPQERLPALMRQVQWGIVWLEKWILSRERGKDDQLRKRMAWALDLAAIVVQETRFLASATSLATELGTRLECDRVSVGFKKGNNIKIAALSHSASFRKQMNLIRLIEGAMDEAADQQMPIVFPGEIDDQARVLRAHTELAEQEGDGAVCTIPLLTGDGDVYGALVMERSSDSPFGKETVELCQSILFLVGPVLEEKRRGDRALPKVVLDSTTSGLGKIIGPGHVLAKLITVAIVLLVAVLSVVTGEMRVTARTSIEGAVQRAITAPYDGYVVEAGVRAGDSVEKAQVIARLDDRDLRLERQRIIARRDQHQRQYREAMAAGDRATVQVLGEQINQSLAQLALIDDQISRASLTAPIAGIVVTGDLSQSLGSPVQRGDVLFEVAPLADYRVMLQVDERDVSHVKAGQPGDMVLNAIPQQQFPIKVEKVTPVSSPFEGRNYFLVEATLEQGSDRIRPGMEGWGKVSVGRRKVIRIWTGGLIDWLRLWFWSWRP